MKAQKNKNSISIIINVMIGSMLEYYDYMLFVLMLPTISPIFFHQSSDYKSLMSGYLCIFLTALIRPIGSIIFGYIGDKKNPKIALFWSMSIMSVASFMIAMMPSYENIGMLAPIGIFICRAAQTMSAGGELNGAAIFLIENMKSGKGGFASGLAWGSTVLGMLLASISNYIIPKYGIDCWRFAFILGGCIGIAALFLRLGVHKSDNKKAKNIKSNELPKSIYAYLSVGLIAAGLSGMFYYTMLFSSQIWQIKHANCESYQIIYFIIYGVSLVLFGYLSDKYESKIHDIMIAACIFLGISAFPNFILIDSNNAFISHGIIVIVLALFVAPSHNVLFKLFPPEYRYRAISLGYAIGTSIIGGITPFAASILSQRFGDSFFTAPAIWMCFVSTIAAVGVYCGKISHKYTKIND